MEDFIGVYENAFTADYCNAAIQKMERAFNSGYGYNRQKSENVGKFKKDDLQIYPSDVITASSVFDEEFGNIFNDVFWGKCYADYAERYSALNELDEHTIYGSKLQRTHVGQGYHTWHSEHAKGENADRILAYIVYLNDVEEGGETEFLYQHKRVKPKQGTLVIWPAGFTHTHRGNPPLSNTKYIMTGWVEY